MTAEKAEDPDESSAAGTQDNDAGVFSHSN